MLISKFDVFFKKSQFLIWNLVFFFRKLIFLFLMHCGSLLAFWRSATTSLNILPERNKSADSASHIYVSRLLVFSIHIFPPLLSPLWCIVFSFFIFYIFSFFNIPPERYKSAGSAPWIHTSRLLCSLFFHILFLSILWKRKSFCYKSTFWGKLRLKVK